MAKLEVGEKAALGELAVGVGPVLRFLEVGFDAHDGRFLRVALGYAEE